MRWMKLFDRNIKTKTMDKMLNSNNMCVKLFEKKKKKVRKKKMDNILVKQQKKKNCEGWS